MPTQGDTAFSVMLVSPNDEQSQRVRAALVDAGVRNIQTCESRQDALDLLHANLSNSAHAWDLVLMSLDDAEAVHLLRSMRSVGPYRTLPVVCFRRTSETDRIAERLESGANACVVLPDEHEEMARVITMTIMFWRFTSRGGV